MNYINLSSKIINDKYTEFVFESFDIQNKEETKVSIPINFGECKTFKWNIGVIYGGLGSLFFVSCKSTSIHENNLTQQAKTMLKHDKQSKRLQQKIRSDKQVKKKLVKSRKRVII